MLKLNDPDVMEREINRSEAQNDDYLGGLEDAYRAYSGQGYRPGAHDDGASTQSPENMYYEWISHVAPQLAGGTPQSIVRTRRVGPQQIVADTMRYGLDRWCVDSGFGKVMLRLAVDYCFRHFAALVSPRARPENVGIEDPIMWPTVERLSLRAYGWDAGARDPEQRRFQYHSWIIDREDLIAHAEEHQDEGWDVDAIEALPTDTEDVDKIGRHTKHAQGMERGEVVIRDVFAPEIETKGYPESEGFSGSILTYASGQGNAAIRKPRGFYGPRTGPYVLCGTLPVPDEVFPLSNLVACAGQIEDLNMHARASSASARSYKRLVLVSADNKRLLAQIKNSPHDFVIPVKGFNKDQVISVELGGITQQMIDYLAIARDRLERNIGLSDVIKGNISGQATATEVSVAAEGSAVRMALVTDQYNGGIEDVLRIVAWYLYHDDRIVFPAGEEAAEALGMVEPWFVGGSFGEGSGATFDDLELQIDRISTQRLTAALMQKQAMTMFDIVTALAPLIPTAPHVDWEGFFEKIGRMLQIPGLDELFDMDAAAAVGQEQMAMQQAPVGPVASRRPKSMGPPLFGRQVGAASPGFMAQPRQAPQVGPRSPKAGPPAASGKGGGGSSRGAGKPASGGKKPSKAKAAAK